MLRLMLAAVPSKTPIQTLFSTNIALNTGLSVLMIVAAIVLGLLLRRLLIRRLVGSVLDNWITQTLGALIVVIPTILGLIGALATWNVQLVLHFFGGSKAFNPDNLLNLSGTVVQTLIIAALGYGIARTIRAWTLRGLSSTRMDINMRTFIARLLYFVVVSVTIVSILLVWQVPVGIPIAVLGTFTVMLTVALQDVLRNLIAGFYILIERPFFIGDQICVTAPGMPKYVGKVEDIQLRATILRMPSGEEVSVPNIFIFSNPVLNNTHYGERRSILEIGLQTDSFTREETNSKLLALLKGRREVENKPEPAVMVSRYIENKIYFQLRFWVKSGQIIDISDVIFEIHELLPGADIAVIEPI